MWGLHLHSLMTRVEITVMHVGLLHVHEYSSTSPAQQKQKWWSRSIRGRGSGFSCSREKLAGFPVTQFTDSVLSRFTRILDKRAQQKCHGRQVKDIRTPAVKHKTLKHSVQARPAACLWDIQGGQSTDARPWTHHSFTTVRLLRGGEKDWEGAKMSAGFREFI